MKQARRTTYSDGDSWRRHQLAEFLERRSAPRQEIATTSSQEYSEIKMMTLIDDLLFKILILLPAHTLFRLQFVSKKWFHIINSSIFIESHAKVSDTVLICRKLTFSDEDKLRSYFHFMDLDRVGNNFIESSSVELNDVLASRDGLILARFREYEDLMILNPITRKQLVLPTLKCSNIITESFGIAFSNEAKTVKIVHVYINKFGCTGCNILSISTRKWRRIEAPSYDVLDDLSEVPLSVGESLYWIKRPCNYYLSMTLKEEKFACKKFPVEYSAYWDKLVKIERRLGFVHHAQVDVMEVWVLMDEGGLGENWARRYSFSLGVVDNMFYMPICCSRNEMEMVIEGPNHLLYAYNLERGEMKLIHSRYDKEAWGGWIQRHHIPHRNTLVWCS